jgi:hypothetical protein
MEEEMEEVEEEEEGVWWWSRASGKAPEPTWLSRPVCILIGVI